MGISIRQTLAHNDILEQPLAKHKIKTHSEYRLNNLDIHPPTLDPDPKHKPNQQHRNKRIKTHQSRRMIDISHTASDPDKTR